MVKGGPKSEQKLYPALHGKLLRQDQVSPAGKRYATYSAFSANELSKTTLSNIISTTIFLLLLPSDKCYIELWMDSNEELCAF